MRYFTSDLHIGDRIISRWRGFEDIAAHDEVVLSGIRERVGADDELWLLGDVCRDNVASVQRLRAALPAAHVYVVLGNHDTRSKFETAGGYDRVEYYDQVGKVSHDGYKFVMSHYPMLDWDRAFHGSYMLHGHIHSRPANYYAERGLTYEHGLGVPGYNELMRERHIRRYDVGVDANGFSPVSDAEIVAFFDETGERA